MDALSMKQYCLGALATRAGSFEACPETADPSTRLVSLKDLAISFFIVPTIFWKILSMSPLLPRGTRAGVDGRLVVVEEEEEAPTPERAGASALRGRDVAAMIRGGRELRLASFSFTLFLLVELRGLAESSWRSWWTPVSGECECTAWRWSSWLSRCRVQAAINSNVTAH